MSTISIRIDEKTKKAASKILASIGLDISSGVKMFLNQVIIENGLPFTPTRNAAVLRAKFSQKLAKARKEGR